jgi:hypothetical protein
MIAELASSMSQVQVDQKTYQMPPQDGFTVAYFLTVADIERSHSEQRPAGVHPDCEHVDRP